MCSMAHTDRRHHASRFRQQSPNLISTRIAQPCPPLHAAASLWMHLFYPRPPTRPHSTPTASAAIRLARRRMALHLPAKRALLVTLMASVTFPSALVKKPMKLEARAPRRPCRYTAVTISFVLKHRCRIHGKIYWGRMCTRASGSPRWSWNESLRDCKGLDLRSCVAQRHLLLA